MCVFVVPTLTWQFLISSVSGLHSFFLCHLDTIKYIPIQEEAKDNQHYSVVGELFSFPASHLISSYIDELQINTCK